MPGPNVGPNSQYQNNRLLGLTAVSPTDIWAFGDYQAASGSGHTHTLLLHWGGTTWTLAPSPSPNPTGFPNDTLSGGVVPAPGNVWIVGWRASQNVVTGTLVLQTPGG